MIGNQRTSLVSKCVVIPHLKTFTDFIFNNAVFPSKCKIAKVVPILKSGCKKESNCYRFISILTCISKLVEK